MSEKEVHQIIIDDINIQKDLAHILNIEFDTMELVHEDQYINLMYADFTVYSNNKIRAIVEVKGGNINVTDYSEEEVTDALQGFQVDDNSKQIIINMLKLELKI